MTDEMEQPQEPPEKQILPEPTDEPGQDDTGGGDAGSGIDPIGKP